MVGLISKVEKEITWPIFQLSLEFKRIKHNCKSNNCRISQENLHLNEKLLNELDGKFYEKERKGMRKRR